MVKGKKPKLENHALRRLAHLFAGGEDQNTLDMAHDFIVEQVLLERGKQKSIKEICEGIGTLFLLRFSKEEVQNSIDRLVKNNKVVGRERFTLNVKREEELRKLNAETKAGEKKIFSSWTQSLVAKYPTLTSEEVAVLLEDLKEYIHRIFLQHGAECSVFVQPDRGNPEQLLNNISGGEINKILPERPDHIKEIRQIEFPIFLQDADTDKRLFLSKLLDGTFIYNIIQVDPATIQALREQLSSYVFYLDTNVIYALLDLHAPKKTSTVEKAFNIARSLGVHFVVSSRTVAEMNKSIELKGKELLNAREIRRDLAQEGADLSQEENFITSYLRSYAKTGITKEDFIEKFRHIPELLKAKGIDIVGETQPISGEELEKEKKQLMDFAPIKSNGIAEHDAYHRLLIRKLREEAATEASGKEYWFLSLDSQLAVYAQKTRVQGDRPFMYMPHQLLQIMRLFQQRTPDFDATFLELFARPQMKFAHNVLPNNLTEKILSKISGFADLPKEIAMKIIVDQKFTSAVSDAKGEDQDTMIAEKVELELTTGFNNLTERVVALEKEKARVEEEKSQLESSSSKRIGTKDQQMEMLKWALMAVSILLLGAASYLFYLFIWDHISFVPRLIALAALTAAFLIVLKLKWKVGIAFGHLGTAIGVATAFFFIAALGLPHKTQTSSEIPETSAEATSTPVTATTSSNTQ